MPDDKIMKYEAADEKEFLRKAILHAVVNEFNELLPVVALQRFDNQLTELLNAFDSFRTEQVVLLKQQIIDLLNVTVTIPQLVFKEEFVAPKPTKFLGPDGLYELQPNGEYRRTITANFEPMQQEIYNSPTIAPTTKK